MSIELSNNVLKMYRIIDETISHLKSRFGLTCPPGCGTCCASPNVEASILEMLPLVHALFERSEADVWLEQMEAKTIYSTCLFYTPEQLFYRHGRCAVYPYRPPVCRLFGYAAVRDKRGAPRFAGCKVMKHLSWEAVTRAEDAATTEAHLLYFTDAASCIANLDPHLGTARFPINEAFRRAMDRVGLAREMMRIEEDNGVVPLEPDDGYRRPRSPGNAA